LLGSSQRLELLNGEVVVGDLGESEWRFDHVRGVNFSLRRGKSSLSEVWVSCDLFLKFYGVLKVVWGEIDRKLIHFLVHSCFLFLIITLSFALSSDSFSLNLLLCSFSILLFN
jgi:hypothetical protein